MFKRWNSYGNIEQGVVSLTLSFHTLALGLSKWVRQLVKHHDSFTSAIQSLVSFSQSQQDEVESHTEELSQIIPESHKTRTSALPSPSELPKLHQCLRSEAQVVLPSVILPSEAGTRFYSYMQFLIHITQK